MAQLYLVQRAPGRPSSRIELDHPGPYWIGAAEACEIRVEGAASIEGVLLRTADRVYGLALPGAAMLLDGRRLVGEALRAEDEIRVGSATLSLGSFALPVRDGVDRAAVAAEPFRWAAEATLRLLVDRVPKKARERARRVIESHDAEYPWQDVVGVLVEQPVDRDDLLRRVLIAQRNLLVRGNAEGHARKPSIVKRGVAFLVARAVFFLCQLLVVVALLVVVQTRWPAADVYRLWARLVEWVQRVF